MNELARRGLIFLWFVCVCVFFCGLHKKVTVYKGLVFQIYDFLLRVEV